MKFQELIKQKKKRKTISDEISEAIQHSIYTEIEELNDNGTKKLIFRSAIIN